MRTLTYCSAKELNRLIQKQPSGTSFIFSVRNEAVVIVDGEVSEYRNRSLFGYLQVTRVAAKKFAQNLSLMDDERVPVRINEDRKEFWFGA